MHNRNYDNKTINGEMQKSEGGRISTSGNKMEDSIEFLPPVDDNKQIILDAL